MPFPYFIRKLFQNDGAGEKLNPNIVPTTVNGVAADASGNIAIKDTNIPNGPFLPTAGGTMNGSLLMSADIAGRTGTNPAYNPLGVRILNVDERQYTIISAGTGETSGAALIMGGEQNVSNQSGLTLPAGGFCLAARKTGTYAKALKGTPDGVLTWDGRNIVTLADHQFNKTSDRYNWWYRKYLDGWIEQGGYIKPGQGNYTFTLTMPTPFSSPYWTCVAVPNGDTAGAIAMANTGYTRNSTSITLWHELAGAELSWYACGY